MLAALTLLPALLALFGKRIKPRAPRPAGAGVFARRGPGRAAPARRDRARRARPRCCSSRSRCSTCDCPSGTPGCCRRARRPAPSTTRWLVHYPDEIRPDEVSAVVAAAPDSGAVTALRDRIADLDGRTRGRGASDRRPVRCSTPTSTRRSRTRSRRAVRDLPAPSRCSSAATRPALVDYRAMLAERLPWAIGLVALGTLVLLFLFTGSVHPADQGRAHQPAQHRRGPGRGGLGLPAGQPGHGRSWTAPT